MASVVLGWRVAAWQLQGRGGFPTVGEAVESFQGFDAAVGAEFGDESAAADALELAGIADEGEPPVVPVGEGDELVEGWCGEHAGFVDDECRAGRKLELGRWWPVGALPFVKQLGDGVGGNAGVALDRSGRLRGRRDGEHDPALCMKVVGGGGEHAGLAGAGGADDEDQPIVAGDGRCGIGLQRVETFPVDGGAGCACAAIAHVRIASSWASTGCEVNRGAVGSIHTDRPSDTRRVVSPGGSRSTSWASTWSVARSRAAAQRRPEICDTGHCRSQIARSASARVHDDRCCDTAAITSGTMITAGWVACAAASSMLASSRSRVQPAAAASACHRVVNSAAP